MKNYLIIAISLLVLSGCASSRYDVAQDKDAQTSCFEVEHELKKLSHKDSKKAIARAKALKELHKKKNCHK